MPENRNLGLKPSPRLEQRDQEVRYQPQASDHSVSDYPIYPRDPARIKFPIGTGNRTVSVALVSSERDQPGNSGLLALLCSSEQVGIGRGRPGYLVPIIGVLGGFRTRQERRRHGAVQARSRKHSRQSPEKRPAF